MYKIVLMAAMALTLAACGSKENTTTTESKPAPQTVAGAKAAPAATQAAPAPTEATPAAPAPTTTTQPDKAALVEQAKLAGQSFSSKLRAELQTAMQSGGPVAAIAVCNTKAPEIAQAVSAETQVQVSRVSLKNRNATQGQAADWQKVVLEDFDKRKAAGESPDKLVYADIVGSEFRFMKAIPTEQVCLTCHGTAIKPEIADKLKTLYPEDKATGYQEGDLRGALVVVKNLAQ